MAQSSKPVQVNVINVFHTWDWDTVLAHRNNLLPLLVLNKGEAVPLGTAPGTAIIRRNN